MFDPFIYQPRTASRSVASGAAAPTAEANYVSVVVPVPFTVTTFPDVDWDAPSATLDHFVLFPPDAAIQDLTLGWSRAADTAPYSAIISCQLVQADGDGTVRNVTKDPVTFSRAEMRSEALVESGLLLTAGYPVYLRITAMASANPDAPGLYPTGPWFQTTGIQLFGTLTLLVSEVS